MHQYLIEKKSFFNSKTSWGVVILSVALLLILLFYKLPNTTLPLEFNEQHKVESLIETMTIEGFGIITSRTKNIISATDNGQLINLYIRSGQLVKQGEELAKIVNYSLEQKFQEAKYEFTSLKSDISLRKNDLLMEKFQLETNVNSAIAAEKKQYLELNANKKLASKGIVSKITYEQVKMTFKQIKLERLSAEKQLKLFNNNYQEQVNSLTAKVSASENRLEFLQKRISALTIKSKVSGIVREVNFSEGQMLVQGQNLFEVIEFEQFIAQIHIPQYSSSQLAIGQNATLVTPNGRLSMEVEYIDSIIRKGSVSVYLAFKDEIPKWIKMEQSIEAKIETVHTIERKFVKKHELFKQYNDWEVYRLTKKGKVTRTDVNIISESKDKIFLDKVNKGDVIYLLPKSLENNDGYNVPEVN